MITLRMLIGLPLRIAFAVLSSILDAIHDALHRIADAFAHVGWELDQAREASERGWRSYARKRKEREAFQQKAVRDIERMTNPP